MVSHGKPHLQRAEAPRQLEGLLEEHERLERIVRKRHDIVVGVREGTTREIAVAEQQKAAIDGLVQPLVEIEGDRICQTKRPDPFRRGERGQATVGSIDV